MRLRTRLQEELRARLTEHLPEAMATIWDAASVVIVIEKLDLKSAGGIRDGWHDLAAFTGTVRAELRADDIDALPVEALLADLVQRPLLVLPLDVPPTETSETARCVLAEMRDTLSDQQVAIGLRFLVAGQIVRRVADVGLPGAVMIGAAPETGPGNEGDYQQIGGGA